MLIYAIIPARSGSKRFPNKNIYNFLKQPLFYHSIFFAKKLKFINKIVFSTDSKKYIKIAKKIPNLYIHKRKKYSSQDTSMEEDIIRDLKEYFLRSNIKLPDAFLWLRPTNPLRCVKSFRKAFKIFNNEKLTVMVVHKTDSRVFFEKGNFLKPVISIFKKKSMVRSQDVKPFYKIFSGEFFKFNKKIKKNFLGKKKKFVIAPKLTEYDIDDKIDLLTLDQMIKINLSKYKKYIHVK